MKHSFFIDNDYNFSITYGTVMMETRSDRCFGPVDNSVKILRWIARKYKKKEAYL